MVSDILRSVTSLNSDESLLAVIMENNTGATTHATGTNNHLEYTGIEFTS